MGISNRLRPTLGRITSSVASTANYRITRVISFITDSFNETSLLLDAALAYEHEPPSPSTAQAQDIDELVLITTAAGTFEIEAPPTPPAPGGGDQGQEPPPVATQVDAESKRVAKVVHTVCLFGASASLLLFLNPPRDQRRGGGGGAVHGANLAFLCLGLFGSLGLSMFSIIARPGEPAVARVQKWGMVAAEASVLAASALRMAMMLPAASLESAWIIAFVLAVVAVYLSLAWKFGGGRQVKASSSPSSSGPGHGITAV
jgi:hypothetical protein